MANAREEARLRLGGRDDVRVLESSPPAVLEPPWFADDPAVPGHRTGQRLIGPTSAADVTWDALCATDEALRPWCAERWLAAWRALPPLPQDWDVARRRLHMLAEHVIAPARYRANGKIGLRWTRGGFGTPFFRLDDRDLQVRLEGSELVLDFGAQERRAPLTTLRAAADFIGIEPGAPAAVYSPETPLDLDADLRVDMAAVAFLSDWNGFATSVLEEVRAGAEPGDDPSRVQLWPEHFDVAFEFGAQSEQQRAGFGASPGDDAHPAPYLYVGPWSPPSGDGWNATSFVGAQLGYDSLRQAADQRQAALSFYADRCAALRC